MAKKKHDEIHNPEAPKDKSPVIPQRPKLQKELRIFERPDLTERQKIILEAALEKSTRCIFIDGLWGTSKSFLAVLASLKLLNQKRIDEIIYIRNPIEASTTGKVGFLPGSEKDKMAPYTAVLKEKLDEFLSKADIDYLEKDERISSIPLGFVRGRSWNCKAIIVDEASSMTWDDLMLLMSRCGEFTRIFIIGDSVNQNDIGTKSGFRRMFETFNDTESMENGVYTFELRQPEDILRSGFLRFVMRKTGILRISE